MEVSSQVEEEQEDERTEASRAEPSRSPGGRNTRHKKKKPGFKRTCAEVSSKVKQQLWSVFVEELQVSEEVESDS